MHHNGSLWRIQLPADSSCLPPPGATILLNAVFTETTERISLSKNRTSADVLKTFPIRATAPRHLFSFSSCIDPLTSKASRIFGELYTLAEFTAKHMPRNKRSVSGLCQGPKYFSFNGISLYKLKESFLKKK